MYCRVLCTVLYLHGQTFREYGKYVMLERTGCLSKSLQRISIMDKQTEIAAAGVGGTFLAVFFRWIIGKRRAKVDLLQAEIKAMQGIVATWKELVDGLKKRLVDLEGVIHELQTENGVLKKEVSRLEKVINDFKRGK